VSTAPTVIVRSGRLGDADDVIEVAGGRVDRGVVEAIAAEAGCERAVHLAGRGTLGVEARLADGLQHGPTGVGLHRVPHVGVRKGLARRRSLFSRTRSRSCT